MEFSFSKEEEALREMLRGFAKTTLKPQYRHWDQTHEFPHEYWRKMGELGVLGVALPEKDGGSGSTAVAAGIAAEEISRGDFNMGYGVILGSLVGDILSRGATAKVRQEFLIPMLKGEKLMAIAVTEPEAGSDVRGIRAEASRDRNGHLRLRGEKSGISLAAVADGAVVAAKETGGISLFAVPLQQPGISRKVFNDMGTRPIGRGSIYFNDIIITDEDRVGLPGQGLKSVLTGFDLSRVLIGLQSLGAALESLDETISYVKEREAFGKTLAEFQGVGFTLAERYADLELLRWYCYRALWLQDQGLPHAVESAICKWRAPRVAVDTIHDCLIMHGQYGYTKDLPLEQRLRDVMGLEIGDGTANIQKVIVAQHLTGVRPG